MIYTDISQLIYPTSQPLLDTTSLTLTVTLTLFLPTSCCTYPALSVSSSTLPYLQVCDLTSSYPIYSFSSMTALPIRLFYSHHSILYWVQFIMIQFLLQHSTPSIPLQSSILFSTPHPTSLQPIPAQSNRVQYSRFESHLNGAHIGSHSVVQIPQSSQAKITNLHTTHTDI